MFGGGFVVVVSSPDTVRNVKEVEVPEGVVKWFSAEKGYGFITPSDGGRDLFVHHTQIQMEGYRNLEQGQKVLFELQDGDRGPQAVEVTVA
jgi:cold shock protein